MVHSLGVMSALLIAAAVLLPSGSLGTLNVKHIIAALGVSFLIGELLVARRIHRWAIVLAATLLVPIGVATVIGLGYGVQTSSLTSQLTAMASTLLLVWLPVHYVTSSRAPALAGHSALRWVIASVVGLALAKVAITFLTLTGTVRIQDVARLSTAIFGQGFITLEVGLFSRIFFPADFISVPLLFALLAGNVSGVRYGKLTRMLLFGLLSVSIFISYSRFLWAFAAVAVGLVLTVYAARAYRSQTVRLPAFIALGGVAVLLVGAMLASPLGGFVMERFTGVWAVSSDRTRVAIWTALWAEVGLRPIFGSGLGHAAEGLIRFPSHPWNYELQWLALLMHFGVAGLLPIAGFLTGWLMAIGRSGGGYNAGLATLAAVWVSVGFFNSFLLTSSAGVVFLTFWLLNFVSRTSRSGQARRDTGQIAGIE